MDEPSSKHLGRLDPLFDSVRDIPAYIRRTVTPGFTARHLPFAFVFMSLGEQGSTRGGDPIPAMIRISVEGVVLASPMNDEGKWYSSRLAT